MASTHLNRVLSTEARNASRYFLDIQKGEGRRPLGRIEVCLFEKDLPVTCDNFRALCTGSDKLSSNGLPLSYKGSILHRIVPGFLIQGGDFTHHNGKGGESIYGRRFKDESFKHDFSAPFRLAMANAGPHTNGSQFFITTSATPWLDGMNVVFGEVSAGHDVLTAIEAEGSPDGVPRSLIRIADCGEIV